MTPVLWAWPTVPRSEKFDLLEVGSGNIVPGNSCEVARFQIHRQLQVDSRPDDWADESYRVN